jgi:hypothetical protein
MRNLRITLVVTLPAAIVPEPSTALLLSLGLTRRGRGRAVDIIAPRRGRSLWLYPGGCFRRRWSELGAWCVARLLSC